MMYNFHRSLLLLCLLVFASNASARLGVEGCWGHGTNDVQGYRFGVQRVWSSSPNKINFGGYWDLAFTRVDSDYNNLEIYSLTPVLRIPFHWGLNWYIDFGIGAAYLSQRYIAQRDLGGLWVFEDRIGAGVVFGDRRQFDIGYRLLHYSNAYIAQVNQSLNLHTLVLGYWF